MNQLRITDYKLLFPYWKTLENPVSFVFNFQHPSFSIFNFQFSIVNYQLSIASHLLVLAMSVIQRKRKERMTDIAILSIRFKKLNKVNDSTTKRTTQ